MLYSFVHLGGLEKYYDAIKANTALAGVIDDHLKKALSDGALLDKYASMLPFFFSVLTDSSIKRINKKYSDAPVKITSNIYEDQGPRPGMEDRQVAFNYLGELMGIEVISLSLSPSL